MARSSASSVPAGGTSGSVAFPWLPAMQPPTVAAALRDATSTKLRFRREASFALRRAAGESREPALQALRRMLEDPDQVVRAIAAESLSVLGDASSRTAIARLVDDGDPGVRAAAVEAVGELSGDAAAALRSLLRHARPDVRARACAVLAEVGGAGVEEDLATTLRDAEPEVRATAAVALGWWYPHRAVAALRAALTDGDLEVRLAAAEALALGGDDAGIDVLRRRVLDGPFDEAWNQAFARFARVAGPADRELLALRAKWPARRVRRAAALAGLARLGDDAAAARLGTWLEHHDPRRRGEALLAAGFTGATRFRDAIARELRHPESPLFETAVVAAVQSADAGLAPAIVETARETADRAVFEELATAAADLARLIGDAAPAELVALAGADFQEHDG